ncbi:MAG: tetratricopeptide repeat protein [Candidatus Korobacteraceae bacterium]|jgi:tetratricopeptide (TPR) repeat protein
MAFRSLTVTCIVLLAAFPLCASNRQQAQAAPNAETSFPVQVQSQQAPAPMITPRPAPVAPTPAEMRAMTADQLKEKGDELRQAKDYLSAVDCYRAAIRKQPSAEFYNRVAISELLLRHPAEAEKAARKAVRKDKHMAEAWNNLAVSYYMRNQFEDAIRAYHRAISIEPDSASFHNNLAVAFMDSKRFELGIAEYRKAFALDPSFFEHASQNGISAHMGSPQDRAQFSYVLARLFAGNGDLDRALHFLRAAMEDGYPKIDDVYRDKEFAQVVKDPRFLELMKERPVAVR